MDAKIKHVLELLTEELKAFYGSRLRVVTLFGSQATGEARADSDKIEYAERLIGEISTADGD